MVNHVLIILGNNIDEQNPSYILAKHLKNLLEEKQVSTKMMDAKDLMEEAYLLSVLNQYESIIFSCPMTMDALPSDVIELMELIWHHREEIQNEKSVSLMIQTYYPESEQNDIAIRITKNFSERMKFNWLGSLKLGQAQIMRGRDLAELKRKSRHIIEALDSIADDIHQNRPISGKAYQLMNKRMMSVTSYMGFINKQWKKTAKENGILKTIKDKPYTTL